MQLLGVIIFIGILVLLLIVAISLADTQKAPGRRVGIRGNPLDTYWGAPLHNQFDTLEKLVKRSPRERRRDAQRRQRQQRHKHEQHD